MSLIDKIKESVSTPIQFSSKKKYSKLDMIILNPVFLFLLVAWVTWTAWDVSRPQTSPAADAALSNTMVYFERGDFDNSELQLSMIVEDYNGTKSANHAKFYLGKIAFVNNDMDKASVLLQESVKKLDYPNLQTEAYIMLAQMEEDSKKAMNLFNSAQKATISQTERDYISILKAKRMINDNNKEKALEILDAIELDNNAYKEMFEHTYGAALGLN